MFATISQGQAPAVNRATIIHRQLAQRKGQAHNGHVAEVHCGFGSQMPEYTEDIQKRREPDIELDIKVLYFIAYFKLRRIRQGHAR